MSSGLSIIIPALNEEQIIATNVLRVHEYLEQEAIPHEIIVVSNGSTDRTVEIVEALKRTNDWLKVCSLSDRGAGRAFVAGVTESRFDYVVGIDADLPAELPFLKMAMGLLPFCSAVYGSKFLGKQQRSLIRVVGSQLYILCSQLFFGFTVSDFSQDSKAFRRADILAALPHLNGWTGYSLELAVYLSFRNKRIIQVSIEVEDLRPSRYNLLHEACFRYRHLFRCWRATKDQTSWFWYEAV